MLHSSNEMKNLNLWEESEELRFTLLRFALNNPICIYIHNLAWLVLASARYIVDKRILNKAKVNMGSNVKHNCPIICNFSQVCLTIRKPNDDEDGSSSTSTSARSSKIKENEKPEAGRLQKLKGKQRRLYNTVR